MRKLLAILATAFFFFGAYNLARSEECLSFPTFVQTLNETEGNTVSPMTDSERAAMYEHNGPPPIAEPFDIAVARFNPAGMVLFVKDGCIILRAGPVPLPALETFLGNPGA